MLTTNSLIEQNYASVTPEPGMGATELLYTDRHAYTVTAILSKRTIEVQADHARRADSNGMSEMQTYEFSPNPEGRKVILTQRSDGHWRPKDMTTKDGIVFMIGRREEYHDFTF